MVNTIEGFDWYQRADLSKYSGKWVLIYRNSVFSHGTNLKKMMNSFKEKYPDEVPSFAKIPKILHRIF